MINVLYVVSSLKRSGPTNQLFNIVSNLDREAITPQVVTLSPEGEDSLWSDFRAHGVHVSSLEASRVLGLVAGRRLLRRHIRQCEAGVVHSQGIRSDALMSGLDVSCVRVSTVRNYFQHDYPMTYGSLLGRAMAAYHGWVLRGLEATVAVSDGVAENLKRRYRLENVLTIRNGVDTDRFSPTPPAHRTILRNEFGWSAHETVWVVSGHLSERKDPLFLIRAWRERIPASRKTRLVFLGGGPLENVCREAADGLGCVEFLGRVPDVARYLQAADGLISASKAEGLPNAVLEAMSCGLPVVLTDIPPHRELVKSFPTHGALYGRNDDRALLRALVEVHSSGPGIAEAIRNSEYSATGMARLYQALYEKLKRKASQ